MAIDQVDRTVVTAEPTTAAVKALRLSAGVHTRRLPTLLFGGLVAFALLAAGLLVTVSPASAAPLAATGACSTGVGNSGGEGIICQITVVNTITATGGSAALTVHECLGSAGDPTDGALGHPCTTTTTALTEPITAVTQCDGSANGGGGKLLCSVVITNNFVGVDPGATAVTVNQCVGSGGSITTGCNPFPAATTDAAITQCNGSANGGGASLTCAATGTMASALVVTIDQCNGSANGGGAFVDCSAGMVNNVVQATPTPTTSLSPTPTTSSSASPGQTVTPPPTSMASAPSSSNSTPLFGLLICLAFGALGVVAVETQRRRSRN
jgi:hypothetical protein